MSVIRVGMVNIAIAVKLVIVVSIVTHVLCLLWLCLAFVQI